MKLTKLQLQNIIKAEVRKALVVKANTTDVEVVGKPGGWYTLNLLQDLDSKLKIPHYLSQNGDLLVLHVSKDAGLIKDISSFFEDDTISARMQKILSNNKKRVMQEYGQEDDNTILMTLLYAEPELFSGLVTLTAEKKDAFDAEDAEDKLDWNHKLKPIGISLIYKDSN